MRHTIIFLSMLVFLGVGCTSTPVQNVMSVVPPPQPEAEVPAVSSPASPASDSVSADSSATSQSTVLDAQAAAEPMKVTIVARKWSFLPATFKVKKGDRVQLQITSIDVRHGFELPEYGISGTLEPGKAFTTEFVADKVGTFSFFCNVFCGAGHSIMRGTMIVE